jgi:hypothetical protein
MTKWRLKPLKQPLPKSSIHFNFNATAGPCPAVLFWNPPAKTAESANVWCGFVRISGSFLLTRATTTIHDTTLNDTNQIAPSKVSFALGVFAPWRLGGKR